MHEHSDAAVLRAALLVALFGVHAMLFGCDKKEPGSASTHRDSGRQSENIAADAGQGVRGGPQSGSQTAEDKVRRLGREAVHAQVRQWQAWWDRLGGVEGGVQWEIDRRQARTTEAKEQARQRMTEKYEGHQAFRSFLTARPFRAAASTEDDPASQLISGRRLPKVTERVSFESPTVATYRLDYIDPIGTYDKFRYKLFDWNGTWKTAKYLDDGTWRDYQLGK